CLLLLFFFSSRRRHTRSKRDWSSDVCSSDLDLSKDIIREMDVANYSAILQESSTHPFSSTMTNQLLIETLLSNLEHDYENSFLRSEERRVGKECRCRSSGDH